MASQNMDIPINSSYAVDLDGALTNQGDDAGMASFMSFSTIRTMMQQSYRSHCVLPMAVR